MLVLFMKLKVHLKKCFHNVHKEMAWDVTFVTKKNCEKVIVDIVEKLSQFLNLSKHIINKHDFDKNSLSQKLHPNPFLCENCESIFSNFTNSET